VFNKRDTDNILGNVDDVRHSLNYGSKIRPKVFGNSLVVDRLSESNRLLKRIVSRSEPTLVVDEHGFNIYLSKAAKQNAYIDKMFRGR
jgi:hypothetical protein